LGCYVYKDPPHCAGTVLVECDVPQILIGQDVLALAGLNIAEAEPWFDLKDCFTLMAQLLNHSAVYKVAFLRTSIEEKFQVHW
jgi:hypothetical protein